MKPIEEVAKSPLVDAAGYVDINKETMQHMKYLNVYGIGDCTSMPGKTAAAVAAESEVLFDNLSSTMAGNEVTAKVRYNVVLKRKYGFE